MQTAPKSMRLHIALMGRVNSGKSSFLNLVSGQDVSIISAEAGTTTDVVEKSQELPPIGPVVWLDTAGFGDTTELSGKRLEKTRTTFERADIVVLVCEGSYIGKYEEEIIDEAAKRKIPLIKIYNKADICPITDNQGIVVNSTDRSSRNDVLNKFKAELIKICPEEFIDTPTVFGDLIPAGGTVIMIVPIDFEAPKGRLILPQVQAIRDGLDNSQIVTIVKESEYIAALNNMKQPPSLVICDSQVVDFMVANTPDNISCTTFSILFARLKGDIVKLVEGAAAISGLADGDKVLIAESCTHHAVEDDIGRVKIPRLLTQKTGKSLIIEHVAGFDFPANLAQYKLVVQCGGCMHNRRAMLSRINRCEQAGVPITNYGVCISELKGVLERVLMPIPQAQKAYSHIKNNFGKIA
ncbi:MAG: [FeFe] hydrogenase H-cluster maturation GTPase HydF [Alphaproteobacteria bacterium]|nr:[FeFe] hydrogenase H-cluster maturation GTPase HydF [Alphaproteobacteria bacterium]